ncbi:MAG: 2,3-bisphosphoglycerate-independent phosphoglycerate mutase [Desulfobacteraceae bacterium Eth-SRB1]|nr:MAG: 2,3-bisphosphoglycerate-independent phosphoglycerate mutase [Desulfobacteraceae bacterium Eth-SRB1]
MVIHLKYVILIADGMADYPLEEFNGKTPLEEANTPNMDFIAREGKNGLALTVPKGLPAGSDVANLSILGYDPRIYYTGRGPIEAASIGITLEEDDIAFRCNLVTEKNGVMEDYSAGHITTAETKELIEALNAQLGRSTVKFYQGISYRHLLVLKSCEKAECTPPHDITGKLIDEHLPRGECSDLLSDLIIQSKEVLQSHPVNQKRVTQNKNPANLIWLWGQGQRPDMPTIKEQYHITGAVISAVSLIKGLGIYAGLDVINVPGATGYFDTDYKAKALYAAQCLDDHELVVVHVEAPDEAGHLGSIDEKIRAIENIDEHIAGKLLDELPVYNDYKLLLLPDHPTPVSIRTHTRDPVPFALYCTDHKADYITTYSEKTGADGVLGQVDGWKLMDLMIKTKL